MSIQFIRVKRGQANTWFVDLGRYKKRLWWKVKHWDRYITTDNGSTWSTMEETAGGWFPSFMLDPSDMRRIDILLGALVPYLHAAGFASQALVLREKQEEYWKRQRWSREQAEAAIQGRDELKAGIR